MEEKLLHHARDFFGSTSHLYRFTENEKKVIDLFFTNNDKPVFFIHSLPESVTCVVLAMYSRLKNARGIRGIFVDSFLPHFFASRLEETEKEFDDRPELFLAHYKIKCLDDFLNYSIFTQMAFDDFIQAFRLDPKYIEEFSNSPKVQQFIRIFLDKYGHNSIARTGKVALGIEGVSILTAKSLEWTRPGSGYIELSTRYVDMSGKDVFDLSWLSDVYGVDKNLVEETIEKSFGFYKSFQGDNFTGPLPEFYREKYGSIITNQKELESAVIGETCDVLGNFLPCATLTSLGIAISGEAFPQLLKHLILDATPENSVILEMILEEGQKIGANTFARHYEPAEWDKLWWQYLRTESFPNPQDWLTNPLIFHAQLIKRKVAERILLNSTGSQFGMHKNYLFSDFISFFEGIPRADFDKLPCHFEKISANFRGLMSFRGWRDLQRQQLATHARTYVTPLLGFYHYNKPAPVELHLAFVSLAKINNVLYEVMRSKSVPPELMQYPLAMGNMIGFQFGSNLRQLEFCNWQRSDFSVNHEVRQIFLGMEKAMRAKYSWWEKFSRADMTPAYIFARTKDGIPL